MSVQLNTPPQHLHTAESVEGSPFVNDSSRVGELPTLAALQRLLVLCAVYCTVRFSWLK